MPTVTAPATPLYVGDKAGKPRKDNGEYDISQILHRLGIQHLYEAFLYPIRVNGQNECTHGFTPDFWIPGSRRLPECHVEVTWPDMCHPKSNSRRARTIDQVIKQKQYKICTTFRIYDIPTLLLDYRACQRLAANPRHLRLLLQRLHDLKGEHDGYFRPGAHHF